MPTILWSRLYALVKRIHLGYYEKEVNEEIDNEPIGLILTEEKDDIMVEYAMLPYTSKLVVFKYQLYLPEVDPLKSRLKEIMKKYLVNI